MREIKKIIWATDGSRESEEALNYAVFLAQRFNSQIIGIHVIPTNEGLLYAYTRDPDSELFRWVEKATENQKARLVSIAEKLSIQGLPFRGEVLIGEPHKEIIRFSRVVKADLIAMGTRGHGLLDRMLTGSTTLKVLRESGVPVLAVKKRDKESAIDIGNIVVPLDGAEKVDSALKYAIDLAERIGASISVLYVFGLGNYDYGVPPSAVEDLAKLASNELVKRVEGVKLKRAIRQGEVTKLEINAEVMQGISPSIGIVEHATSKNADLIVINTHGRKGVKKFILGSVTERVIQESPCPVLALKP
jgi:nucleotide-binding universal stress UspA family protein